MKRHVLILRGVKIPTINLENNICEDIVPDIPTQIYDKIPCMYSTNTWPSHINIKCWTCCRLFTTRPYFITTRYLKDVTGNFCSAPCAMTHIDKEIDKIHRWESIQQLKELEYQFTGKRPNEIIPAPNRFNRQEYGGDLTDKELDRIIKQCIFYDML